MVFDYIKNGMAYRAYCIKKGKSCPTIICTGDGETIEVIRENICSLDLFIYRVLDLLQLVTKELNQSLFHLDQFLPMKIAKLLAKEYKIDLF